MTTIILLPSSFVFRQSSLFCYSQQTPSCQETLEFSNHDSLLSKYSIQQTPQFSDSKCYQQELVAHLTAWATSALRQLE